MAGDKMKLSAKEMEKLIDKCIDIATRAWRKNFLPSSNADGGDKAAIGTLAAELLDYCLEEGIHSDSL